MHSALQSPLFDGLRPTDALASLVARCRPAALTTATALTTVGVPFQNEADASVQTSLLTSSLHPGGIEGTDEDEALPVVTAAQVVTAESADA